MKFSDKQLPGVSRRTFLVGSVGTGVMMGFGLLSGCSDDTQVPETSAARQLNQSAFSPTVWFEVAADGVVNVNIAKAEMGQHVGTALARIVADELGADWSTVRLTHVDSDPKWGYMVTGGSWSVFTSFKALSQAGAAGRQVLCAAGAELMGVEADSCVVRDGRVTSGTSSVSFADIVQQGNIDRTFSQEELDALPLMKPENRRLIGKATTALDIPEKTRGAAVYGLDVERPGMVYARPVMPPTRYGCKVTAVDDTAAKSVTGYQQYVVLTDPSDHLQGWVLAIASDYPAAIKAADALKVSWDEGPGVNVSEQDILQEGEQLCADPEAGALFVDDGNVREAREKAASSHTAVYRTASALHFPLEPMNAIAEFSDSKWHIHAGNQWQSLILPVLAKALEVPETDIVLHQYFLGGGFGRRLFGDYMLPAALAAKQLGKPVKVVFTRSDDSRFDCIRSPSVQQFEASFDSDNGVTGIEHAAAAGWPTLSMAPGFLGDGLNDTGKWDGFSISGADHWYTLPSHRVRAINNPLAQSTFLPGWLRAVGPGWIGWGVESFMDEVAHKAGIDPLEYRLGLLDATGKNAGKAPESVGGANRLRAVLNDVKSRSGWGRELPPGEGLGVATCFGQERTMPTWVACVAHVKVRDDGTVEVKKLYQAIDCGTVVHPDGAMAQAEGAALWGVSLTLHEGTRIERGQVAARNLDTYTPMRMSDVPDLDIAFMDSTEFPTGLGEPPLIAVPPAIGNAVFAATGKRLRDLPIRPEAVLKA